MRVQAETLESLMSAGCPSQTSWKCHCSRLFMNKNRGFPVSAVHGKFRGEVSWRVSREFLGRVRGAASAMAVQLLLLTFCKGAKNAL